MKFKSGSVAVIGAGDFIGAAIAKKFAAEGFTVFAGRRNGDKLAPLIAEVEAQGGRIFARSLDARKEDDITAFLNEAEHKAPLEVCIFNIGANVNFPLVETTERVFRKVWEMACYSGFLTAREAARRARMHLLHRCDREPARWRRLRGVREREIRPARCRSKCGARARTKKYSRRPSHYRCRRGYRMGARSDQGARRRRRAEESRPPPPHEARRGRRVILATLRTATRRVDLRARNPAFRREMVTPWQTWNFISISAAPMLI